MAIWRLGALGEKAACEEMHLSGNQHTPCQTLFGLSLSTVATSPARKPEEGGGAHGNDTAASSSRRFPPAPPASLLLPAGIFRRQT